MPVCKKDSGQSCKEHECTGCHAKELYEGRFIGIGDTVVFNDYEWGVWDCNNPGDVAPNIDTFTVTDVEYDDHFEAYYFNTDSRYVEFIAVRSEEALDPAPTGFYVTGGNGTEEAPFTFELAYDSITYTYHAAVPATCTTDGTIEYWEGSDGKNYIKDGEVYTEYNGEIIIPKINHSFEEHECTGCHAKELYEGRFIGIGDTVVFNDTEWGVWDCNNPEDVAPNIDTFTVTDVEYDDHFEAYYFNTDSRFVEFIAVRSEEALDPAPTGFYVTGGNGTEESPFIFELAYDSVTYTYHAAVPATCTTDGTIEYWEGSDGKYYADENGNTEIDSIIIPATGHSYDESLFILTWINKYNHCNIIVN